jgi:GTP-binding protein HflX
MDVPISRRERAVLVACALKSPPKNSATQSPLSLEESLDELASLTTSAGGAVVERLVQEREQYDSAYLIGSGKLRELEEVSQEFQAEVVIFDENLSPAQQRNIERKIGCRVIDRTQLILDIFASRARTREGKASGGVGAAQLHAASPRRTRSGTLKIGRWHRNKRPR